MHKVTSGAVKVVPILGRVYGSDLTLFPGPKKERRKGLVSAPVKEHLQSHMVDCMTAIHCIRTA